MINRSRSTLFLMEQLIVIMFFSIFAAVCVNIFFESYKITAESKDKNGAVIIAESVSETFKATNGDAFETARVLEGDFIQDTEAFIVYYDKQWRNCTEDEAEYMLIFTGDTQESTESLALGNIAVTKPDGKELIAIPAAARRVPYE